MRRFLKVLNPTVLIIAFMFSAVFADQANEPGLKQDSGLRLTTVSKQDSQLPSDLRYKPHYANSAFHQWFKSAKARLNDFGEEFASVFSNYSKMGAEISMALNHMTEGRGSGHLIKLVLLLVLLIGVGYGVEKLINIPLKKHKKRLQGSIPKSFLQLAGRLAARTLIELFSFGVFALTIIGVYLLFYPIQSPLYELAMVFLPPIFFIRLAFIVLNALFSPAAPHMRISPQNCISAATYFFGFLAFMVISLFVTKSLWLLRSHGLSNGVFQLLYSHLGMVQFLILLAIVTIDRNRITRALLRQDEQGVISEGHSANWLKRFWFPITCVGLLAFELMWQVNLILYQKDLVLPLLLTIMSIPFGLLVFNVGNRMLRIAAGHTELMDPRVVNKDILTEDTDLSKMLNIDLPPEPVSATDGNSAKNESFVIRNLALIRKMMGILIFCALFFWIMNLWGLDLPLGRSIVQSALTIFTTLLVAYAIWEICRAIIDRKLEEDRAQSGVDLEESEEGGEGSRKGTLLTLLRKFIMALIGVVVILTILHAIGINIGPMLAGAGILGLAIGFGSQKLVTDILSGLFFLMDDAFRVGDYIEAAGTKGMVQQISLRSLSLRHPRGMVYTIPFGDMGSVQNFSRDYIISKLDFRVRYDTDVEKVRKAIKKKVYKPILANEELAPKLLAPIKSQGVRQLEDSAMIMRVKFKTAPGDQFEIRKEVFRLMQEAFKEEGIEFAHRNVTVYLPQETTEDETKNADTQDKIKQAAAAAALTAKQDTTQKKSSEDR
jgi:small-conductance mechanosensitive channel